MFRVMLALLTFLVIASSASLSAQSMSDAEVEAAIAAGQNKKAYNKLAVECIAAPGFGEGFAAQMAGGMQSTGTYEVTLVTNIGRVAFLAAEAKRLYKPFSVQDVPYDLRAPALSVFVEPRNPNRSQSTVSVAAPIQRIVIRSRKMPDAFAPPETFETDPVIWRNLLGGQVDNNRALATFSMESVSQLPDGDLEVVVIATAGERRCRVFPKERTKLFALK